MKKNKNIFSWKVSPEDMKNQVENYKTLKITRSHRGISILIITALLLLGFLVAYFDSNTAVSDVFLSLIVYIPVLLFTYKGHRWAIIILLALFTFEQMYTFSLTLLSGSVSFISILLWLIIAPYIFKAFLVEQARKKNV